jgi:SAM-dependent methyltransferase
MPVVERYAAPLSAPLTKPEFVARAGHFAEEAGVKEGAHKYFTQHRSRLWTTGSHFDLWNLKGKSVLEIGPFYSYIPFLLAEQKNSVTVLEGDDPAVNPLIPIYKRLDIEVVIADLFENFGTANLDRHRLPFDENQFDIVNCWETMEHFNFNPVGFVQEVRRILKPGGLAFITVPNIAKLDWRIRLLLGKPISPVVSSYFEFYRYHGGRFLGWHWREYLLSELIDLFSRGGFGIKNAAHLLTFTEYETMSLARNVKRALGRVAFTAAPSLGTICAVTARKS